MERHGYLRLLVDEAPLPRYDEVLRDAAAHAASAVELERTARRARARPPAPGPHGAAARPPRAAARAGGCAKELADVHIDPDRVLTLIVTQAQRLLGADMAYLSLNDDERRETRMRVMVGATSSVWKDVPIPYGTGVGGNGRGHGRALLDVGLLRRRPADARSRCRRLGPRGAAGVDRRRPVDAPRRRDRGAVRGQPRSGPLLPRRHRAPRLVRRVGRAGHRPGDT